MYFSGNFFNSDNRPLMESMDTMDSWRTASTTLVDLRKEPRYATLFPGDVLSENGNRTPVTITNISESGLRVEGNLPDLPRLMPHMDQNEQHTPVSLQVCFSLPGSSNQTCDIQVQGESVYVIFGNYRDFKIGMQLTVFDQGYDSFLEYISFRKYGR